LFLALWFMKNFRTPLWIPQSRTWDGYCWGKYGLSRCACIFQTCRKGRPFQSAKANHQRLDRHTERPMRWLGSDKTFSQD
jgi:hypothetical protein